MPTELEKVAAFREAFREERIGAHYSGWAHFSFTSIVSLAVIGAAVTQIDGPSLLEWLVVPAGFFIANLAEYAGHRGPMHKPRRGLRILYQRHTLEHHRFFTHETMAFESARDFKITLFPPVMLVFFLGFLAGPIAALFFVLASANAGWLFVTVAMSYFLTYEWLHFSYHLDERSLFGRTPVLARLRAHHQAHHDPRLMSKKNFNITFPICDALFGTRHSSG